MVGVSLGLLSWRATALDIVEVLACAVDSHVHVFVADVIKSLDTVHRGILDRVLSSLGFVMCILSIMLMIACALSLLLHWWALDS